MITPLDYLLRAHLSFSFQQSQTGYDTLKFISDGHD